MRRDVTGQFVQGFLGQTFQSLGGLLIPILASGLCIVGIVLVIVGAVFSRRRALRTAGDFVFPTHPVITSAAPPADLAAKLRQLDDARASGLISEEEYQRSRQNLLDTLS